MHICAYQTAAKYD